MKLRISIVALLVFAALVFFVLHQLAYPTKWNDIQLGMTREEVYERVGSPSQDWGSLKGAFWNENKLIVREELWVYFSNDKVSNMSIKRHIGTEQTFYVQNIRHESSDQ
jgi:outer membrane protein assembly factor BamE (lipoprotein component of BamABCDE complex)